MYKKYLILVISLLSIASCSNNETNNSLKIITPTGAPCAAFYNYFENENFLTLSDPSLLKSYFASGLYDVIVAPTDVGIKAINSGAEYKIASTITFGNFYLVSTGLDDDNILNNGDSIVLFQQDGVPDKIFHYIYGNTFDNHITYVKNVAMAAVSYETKKVTTENGEKKDVDYVLLAEPKLTAMSITGGIINLRNEFLAKSNGLDLYQASLFVNNKSNKEEVDSFLLLIENDIQKVIDNPVYLKEALENLDDPVTYIGINPKIVESIFINNKFGLGYKSAKENKSSIDNYLKALGMENSDENIYY